MTHDILPSDVELAQALIRDKCPEAYVVAALCARGVDGFKAAHLVDDLQHGRRVEAAMPRPTEPLGQAAPSMAGDTPAADGQKRPRSARKRRRTNAPASSSTASGSRSLAPWLAIAGVAMMCAAAGGWVAWKRFAPPKASSAADLAYGALPGATSSPSSSDLVLELAPEGLRIGSSLITRQNALSTITGLLGLPTRTNRVDQPHKAIYAYDRQGILYYSSEGAGSDSIMLDCDAMGGTNGTKEAFAGVLKVEDNMIHVDTDADSLTAIKKLGLAKVAPDSVTFKGRCCSLDLYFGYLKSPARLSFIEIDLKE
jgi:hypothetical protein